MAKAIAAALTAVLLGLVTNLVSNYLVPVADKRRKLTVSILAALTALTVLLATLPDSAPAAIGRLLNALVVDTLQHPFGWILLACVVLIVIVSLAQLTRRALLALTSPPVSADERAYLKSLIAEIDRLNLKNDWRDDYFIERESEIAPPDRFSRIRGSYYLVRGLNPGVGQSDFESLPNAEKVESSRGITYSSLTRAASQATDTALVVLSPPGGGKTVALRRLARDTATARLRSKLPIPVFVNLAYYTGWTSAGEITSFERFLDSYFARGYLRWLSDRRWERLLRTGRCIFFLDGLDEIPRSGREHYPRLQEVERFVRDWPSTRFFLSCRELDYDYRLGFQQILIKPFNLRRIKRFVGLYFDDRPELRLLSTRIWKDSPLYRMAKTPFYLNLICGYIRWKNSVPVTRPDLFSLVVESVLQREATRAGTARDKAFTTAMIDTHADLAARFSLTKMATTLSVSEFTNSFPVSQAPIIAAALDAGVRGGLTELDDETGTLRFTHHRFQEFFCAIYISRHLGEPEFTLPPDFFLSIWWREIILMVSTILEDPTDFVQQMLSHKGYSFDFPRVAAAARLNVVALAHESLLANESSKNTDLASTTRGSLIAAFARETPLGKVKILSSLADDSSEEAADLISTAEKDPSNWVAERAFLARTEGALRFRRSFRGAVGEFGRFLLAGRIFSNAPSVIALATRSEGIRWLLPLYALFMALGVVTIGLVFLIAGLVVKFLVFDLHYSFDSRCLHCLATVGTMVAILAYLLTRRKRLWLQRFLIAGPMALVLWFLVFNVPDSLFLKATGIAIGLVIAWGLDRRSSFKDSNEPRVLGFVLGLFLTAILAKVSGGALSQINGPSVPLLGGTLVPLILIIITIGIAAVLVGRDLLALHYLRESRRLMPKILTKGLSGSSVIRDLLTLFSRVESYVWAQGLLLDELINQLSKTPGLSDSARLEFLLLFGQRVPPSPLQDIVFQRCEEVEGNLRRRMGRPS